MVGAPIKPTAPPVSPPPPKPRPTPLAREGAGRGEGRSGAVLRAVVSLVLVWHVAGIVLAALSVSIRSPLVLRLAQRPPVQWYLDALYLNHDRSFFVPEIGPSHIIRYELFDPSGRPVEQGELPNRKLDWPRLYYHRHLLLADQLQRPAENQQLGDEWQRKLLRAVGQHLLRLNENAQSVRLRRIAHWPLPRDLAEQGVKPTDPKGYELLAEETVRRETATAAAQPLVNPNQPLYWQGNGSNVANRVIGMPR